VPHSELGDQQLDARARKSISWEAGPLEGMQTIFRIWLAKAGARLDERWPGEPVGARLIGKLHLENGETVWLTADDQPISPPWPDKLAEARDLVLARAQECGVRIPVDGTPRGYVLGPDDTGVWVYVDLYLPEVQEGAG
jgi:hypothetical protein